MRLMLPHLSRRRQLHTTPLQPHLTLSDLHRVLQTKATLLPNLMLAPAPVVTGGQVLSNRKRRIQIPRARTGVLHFG